jgi:hypothetical protein
MRLIGASMRLGSASLAPDDSRALSAIHAGALGRVSAEHDQSFAVRVRAMFDDMRLFWPAIGASAALAACFFIALSVMQAATAENPASLAAMIDRLDRPSTPVLPPANPGSDQNPMRLDGRVSFPRGLDGMPGLESTSGEEVAVAVSAVVTREGRIATYDLLESEHKPPYAKGRVAGDVSAVLDAVKRSRFAPAEAAGGTKVAVNMVWLLVRTTAKGTARVYARPAPPAPDIVKPIEIEETPVVPSTEAPPAANPSTA